ncbi:MAG: tetratricopeptide repeat protein, partial [Polyangiales bacterium]
AAMLQPWIGWWGIGVAGVLTLVAAGFGLYVWRLTRKSASIVDILKEAKDPEGRKAALEKLSAAKGAGKDALNALARAQLVAQERPAEAIEILESVDLKKAPAVVQDDIRANLALMYLLNNRVRDASDLVENLRLDRQPQAKAKGMYAAVMAETYARTKKAGEAKKLLETYDPDDPEYAEVKAMLLRAQVYTYTATKNRGLARKAMEKLLWADPNMVAAFAQKGQRPELTNMAKQLLNKSGAIPKQRQRIMR